MFRKFNQIGGSDVKLERPLLAGCCGNTQSYLEIAGMGYDYIELSARELMMLSDEEFQTFLELYRRTGFPCRGFNDFCGSELPIVGPNSCLDALSCYMEQLCRRGSPWNPDDWDWGTDGKGAAGSLPCRSGGQRHDGIFENLF